MNIIIIGSNSELGKSLITKLIKNNQIIAISRNKRKFKNNKIKFLNFGKMDNFFFKKYNKILKFFKNKIDVVIYLPAIRDSQLNKKNFINEIDKFYKVNSLNFIKFINYNISRSFFKKTHLVYISSVSVFLNLEKNKYYGSSKVLMEFFLKSLEIKNPNLSIAIYRLGYLNTKKNETKKLILPKCDLSKVSNYIIKSFFIHRGIMNYPRFWTIIKILILFSPRKFINFFYKEN